MATMRVPSTIAAVIASLFALLLYNRAGSLSALYTNAPGRLGRVNILNNPNIKFLDLLRNCEDVHLDPEDGFALLSCDPSRDVWNTVMGTFVDPTSSPATGIYLWHYSQPASLPTKLTLRNFAPGSTTFHPLGFNYHAPTRTLYAINHAPSGSTIETFRFSQSENTLTHLQTLTHATITTPNSLVLLSEHEILVTNDHYFRKRHQPVLAELETYLGLPGGNIVYLTLNPRDPSGIAHAEVLASLPFANGITRLNTSTIAAASSSANAVYLYNILRPTGPSGQSPQLTQVKKIGLPFHPDNLSVDTDGTLLIAGHPHGPTLGKVAANNRFCHPTTLPSEEERAKCAEGEAWSWVASWSEREGVRTLYVGDEYGTSATAVRDGGRGVGVVAGLYGRGIYVWDA